MVDTSSIGGVRGNVTGTDESTDTVTRVMRGLLHELANVATVVDGARGSLEHDGAGALDRAREELAEASDRIFALHADLRSLLPDREGRTPLDPRALAADVVRLLAWHVERPLKVTVDEGPVAPVLGEAWALRRQLLSACDSAAGAAAAFRFGLRTAGDVVVAVDAAGAVFWSAPTLAAERARERGAG